MRLFKNEGTLSPEYVPQSLPHREGELKLLSTFFSSYISGSKAFTVRVMVSGPVGTGKTALCRLFGSKAEEEAAKQGINIRYIHINCKIHATLFSVIKRIIEVLKAPIPSRGLSNEELMHNLLNYLEHKKIFLILGLDEVDGLIREEGEALYFLSRIGEERGSAPHISLLMITRATETLTQLDEVTKSMIKNNIIYLSEYTTKQLRDILEYRCSEAFMEGAVTPEAMNQIVEAAASRGDARYAIEILWRAGKFAENEGAEAVYPEHVRKAAASVYPAIKRESLSYLNYHEKLILLAATRLLKESEKTYITSSELNSVYRIVCEEYGVTPRAYTRFWEYLQRLEDLGILRIKVSSEGSRGRRSYITFPEVPVSILQRELRALLDSKKTSTDYY